MLKSFLSACLMAGALALLPAAASAKTYRLPAGNPVISITMPDDWETTAIDKGIESQSEDEDVYVAVEVVSWKNVEATIEEWSDWLVRKKVKINDKSQRTKALKVDGMDAVELSWDATDSDGPTEISLTIIHVTETRAALITGWASEEAQKENMDEIISVFRSLKKLD
jgi:hypothetical protein